MHILGMEIPSSCGIVYGESSPHTSVAWIVVYPSSPCFLEQHLRIVVPNQVSEQQTTWRQTHITPMVLAHQQMSPPIKNIPTATQHITTTMLDKQRITQTRTSPLMKQSFDEDTSMVATHLSMHIPVNQHV